MNAHNGYNDGYMQKEALVGRELMAILQKLFGPGSKAAAKLAPGKTTLDKKVSGALRTPVQDILRGKIKPTMSPYNYDSKNVDEMGNLAKGFRNTVIDADRNMMKAVGAGALGNLGINLASQDVEEGIAGLNKTKAPAPPKRKAQESGAEEAPAGSSHKHDARDVMRADQNKTAPSKEPKQSKPTETLTPTSSTVTEGGVTTEDMAKAKAPKMSAKKSKSSDGPLLSLTPKGVGAAAGGVAGAGLGAGGSMLYGKLTGNRSRLRDILSGLAGGGVGAASGAYAADKYLGA